MQHKQPTQTTLREQTSRCQTVDYAPSYCQPVLLTANCYVATPRLSVSQYRVWIPWLAVFRLFLLCMRFHDPPSLILLRRSHHLKGSLHKDSFTEDVVSRPISGRGGARGEFTRWPGESGSKYCVSVFVDEYAKWGSHPSLPAPSHATASGTS